VPPPPAYGNAPPPPPPAYNAPPAPAYGAGGYDAAEAIRYGWAKFRSSPSTLLVPVLVVGIIVIVLEVVVEILIGHTLTSTHYCTRTYFGASVNTRCGPGFITRLFAAAVGGLVISFISQALGAGLIKSALNVVDGKEAHVSEVLAWATKPNVLATAALVSAATFVGTLLCYVPGIIVGFLLAFAMFFVVDKDQAPTQAVRSSVSFITGNLGSLVVFYLLGIVCIIVGTICCLVGLLAAVPVLLAGAAYTFRVLQNEPVSPVA
jgi:uncharacterized membrane protein